MKLISFVAIVAVLSCSEAKLPFLSDDFIREINAKGSTWIAGRNFPEDTPLEELRRLSGELEESSSVSLPELRLGRAVEEIPESFDARTEWPYCQSLHQIRNQGKCGSCWAFASTETMTDRLCIASKGSDNFEFSPEDLISCCSLCGRGCDGGVTTLAWVYWVIYGIVSGGDYESNQGCQPYSKSAYLEHTTPKCAKTCLNTDYSIPYESDKRNGSTVFQIVNHNTQEIQREIITNGPLVASFEVYEDFHSYKSGVYQHVSGNKTGRHAVKILGWGTENEIPYWLVANSWGAQWGNLGGFFKILRGENHCGFESFITGGLPKL